MRPAPPPLSNQELQAAGASSPDLALYRDVQADGTFHAMKEKLRATVQLVANSRFRKAPASGAGHDAYCSELFTAISSQLNSVLINKFTDNKAVDPELFPTAALSFERELRELLIRAEEAATSGDVAKAIARHEDRVAIAKIAAKTGDADGIKMLSSAWNEKASFCLKSMYFDRALECMKQSASCLPLSPKMTLLYASAMLNSGMYDLAESAFNGALEAMPADDNTNLTASIHAGLCVLHSAVDELEKTTYEKVSVCKGKGGQCVCVCVCVG